jgi:hypothetical protein
MKQTSVTFATLAIAGTLSLSAAEQPTSYAPPLPICKRPFVP